MFKCLCLKESEDDSDESDGEELAAVAAPAALSAVEGDEPDDDTANTFEVALGEAVERAEEFFQCNEVPEKICHCTCQLWAGNRCIEQFSAAECDDIRYRMHSQLSTHKLSISSMISIRQVSLPLSV